MVWPESDRRVASLAKGSWWCGSQALKAMLVPGQHVEEDRIRRCDAGIWDALLGKGLDLLAVDGEGVLSVGHVRAEAAMHRVILQHVLHVPRVHERVVHSNDDDVISQQCCTCYKAADSAETCRCEHVPGL